MNYFNILEIIIIIWFSMSVFIEIASSLVFWFWLRRHGVNLVFSLIGIPGYMESAYRKWCRKNGVSGKTVLILRISSIINVIIASVFFIMLVSSKN
jgi:hypothetical protein